MNIEVRGQNMGHRWTY